MHRGVVLTVGDSGVQIHLVLPIEFGCLSVCCIRGGWGNLSANDLVSGHATLRAAGGFLKSSA